MSKPKVLIVLTSHGQLGDTGKPSGFFLNELCEPLVALGSDAEYTVASPKGGAAPLDPSSVEHFKSDPRCQSFLQDYEHLWKNTDKLSNYIGKAQDFAAIFYVGGHGRSPPPPGFREPES